MPLNDHGLCFNIAAFLPLPPNAVAAAIRDTLAAAQTWAQGRGEELRPNTCPQLVNDDLLSMASSPALGFDAIDRIRQVLALFAVQVRGLNTNFWLPAPYPALNLEKQKAVFRYGNVELRVIENYLLDRPALAGALDAVLAQLDDDAAMHRSGKRSNHLSSDDPEWNLRDLMTIAGFYVHRDRGAAWSDLSNWAERYLAALQHGHFSTYPAAYPYYFKIQRIFLEKGGYLPSYVCNPGPTEFYSSLAGKDVAFMTPLADLVNRQFSSGNLRRLYADYDVPEFSLRAIPAWMSIWPHRPHQGWSDTFEQMCRAVDAAYEERPFEVFSAACGCYGLPIADYAYSTYGVKAIYLGNISHAFFGVRQQGTRDFMKGRINPDAWIDGDLGQRYPNLSTIERGRYA